MVFRVDLHQGHVVEDIPADDSRCNPVAVLKLDVDAAGAVHRAPLTRVGDHVRVREDVAVLRDDEARALRQLSIAAGAVLGEDRDHAVRAARVDPARVEAVAGERLRGRPDGRWGGRITDGNRRGAKDSRSRTGADPAGRLANRERRDAAYNGTDEREGCRSHSRRTVATVFTGKRVSRAFRQAPARARRAPLRAARG